METSSPNRIPLRVNHGDVANDTQAYSSSRTFTKSATDNHHQNNHSAYDMRNMNDETDRIKLRMREFEERCKRWREDFFSKSNGQTSLFDRDRDFDQRVPFNTNTTTSSSDGFGGGSSSHKFSNPGFAPASSGHKAYLEDASDGTKKYKIEFDIGDFRQNEILITTNGRSLVLKGDREMKAGSATETKTFNRELTLPDYVDFDKMNAYLLENDDSNASSPTTKQQKQSSNNVLVIESPVVMEKYAYRRSAFDQTSPRHVGSSGNLNLNSNLNSPIGGQSRRAHFDGTSEYHGSTAPTTNTAAAGPHHRNTSKSTTTLLNPSFRDSSREAAGGFRESHHESKTTQQTSSTSKSTTSRVVQSAAGNGSNLIEETSSSTQHNGGRYPTTSPLFDDFQQSKFNSSPIKSSYTSPSHLNLNTSSSLSPELIPGYPIYDNNEGCVVYKFDLAGFDQSEIHLTITVDRTLEIKACKELTDHLGKIYREFKREIQLEPEVDANLIKNLLHEGILTLKIPKPNRPDGLGSLSNTHNLHGPNGFREIYTDDGKLAKITTDFRGYNPENLKIVLSANNVLKITAQQVETPANTRGSVQKECTRQYALPSWIQPEQMKAVMSRDGLLTIDFTNRNANVNHDERISIS